MAAAAQIFDSASREGRMTFMPFLTAGDPDTDTTAALIRVLADAEVDLIELGFPYSDPIADGPVIQASYTRALAKGLTVEHIFGMMRTLPTDELPPILAMVSFALIFRCGTNFFIKRAAEAGFGGLIVPDLPAEEADEIAEISAANSLDLVQLIAPTTSPGRTDQILSISRGFVYCISVAGTTGVRNVIPAELSQQLQHLRRRTRLPLAVGFGISSPDQAQSLEGVADGVIVGSAIVRMIAKAETANAALISVREFAVEMAHAVHRLAPSRKL